MKKAGLWLDFFGITCIRIVNLQPTYFPHQISLTPFRNPRSQNLSLTMSEPTNLVPNLNEIMEEYTEREEETVQAAQAETKQEEGRVEEIPEPE